MKLEYHRKKTLTLNGLTIPRMLSFIAGLGMIAASVLTIGHFFEANYPETIFAGSFCDISAFFNCDSSAFSSIAQIYGVPLGYFGLFMGALIILGTIIPSEAFERTNKFLSLFNFLGVLGLLFYSVFVLRSLCLLCSGYYLFSIFNFILFAVYGIDNDARGLRSKFLQPSFRLLVVMALIATAGAYGFILYHDARKQVQEGSALQVVKQFYELPKVNLPSYISPYWTVKSTENFVDAPIHIVEYVDPLCSDCLYFNDQLIKLKKDFEGRINVAFQFFPLEGECNKVVEKDIHPGACELSYIMAADLNKFQEIHDEIWANFRQARDPQWRHSLALKYNVDWALTDPAIKEIVQKIINTGAEYEKTSAKYSHGIRSTPTMIINNRMIIGTLPYHHLKAICQALVEEYEGGKTKFIEQWVKPVRKKR